MIEELIDELMEYTPTPVDNSDANESDTQSLLCLQFETKCRLVFPVRRFFVNYKQLDQYLSIFLNSWKIKNHR